MNYVRINIGNGVGGDVPRKFISKLSKTGRTEMAKVVEENRNRSSVPDFLPNSDIRGNELS